MGNVTSINGYKAGDDIFYEGKKWIVLYLFSDGVMFLERKNWRGKMIRIIK